MMAAAAFCFKLLHKSRCRAVHRISNATPADTQILL
jgi:hypothetical protein